MYGKEEYLEDILKKFNLNLNLNIFLLTRKFNGNFTKCKKKRDLEGFEYYYEIMDKDKRCRIILTSNENNNGYLEFQGLRRKYFRLQPTWGERYGYSGGIRSIDRIV